MKSSLTSLPLKSKSVTKFKFLLCTYVPNSCVHILTSQSTQRFLPISHYPSNPFKTPYSQPQTSDYTLNRLSSSPDHTPLMQSPIALGNTLCIHTRLLWSHRLPHLQCSASMPSTRLCGWGQDCHGGSSRKAGLQKRGHFVANLAAWFSWTFSPTLTEGCALTRAGRELRKSTGTSDKSQHSAHTVLSILQAQHPLILTISTLGSAITISMLYEKTKAYWD